MLAASFGGWAQTAPAEGRTLPQVTVKERAEAPEGKEALRATTTNIGKGTQELRDIPQSITVVTEKLMDDRNLDTVKDALRQTSGITFLAAEGGEEDIRLRGFSLAGTGDIFLDGMRDPAFYDRDTFNLDRVELLRGSASMLFGRGSTGGAVNQVSKVPRLINQHEVITTLSTHSYGRVTGDFNFHTGENAALRLNAMVNKADNNGAGSSIDKHGLAGSYRWGIGTANEFIASFYYLDNDNGMNYGLPWIKPRASDTSAANTIIGSLAPDAYYGMASDYSAGGAKVASFGHIHRFGDGSELKSQVRAGDFKRDQRAATIRFAPAAQQPGGQAVDLSNFGPNTVFTRGTNLKVQDVETIHAQSDLSTKFQAFGFRHELTTGIDAAREEKKVYAALTAAQGGPTLVKPPTLAGTPGDGASIDEGLRVFRPGNQFVSKAWGIYAQDLVQVAPHWKLLAGLRYDNLDGAYDSFAVPANATSPVTTTSYRQQISEVSHRLGVLFQPDAFRSFHFSYGSSFNTSGDTYSYNAQSANTPPEQSRNFEIGAKLDTSDKRFTTRLALFHSTKTNERNTDPDTAATRLLLSGKRHSAGFEVDVVGRLTPRWEIYGSYTWMPIAKVDKAASTATTVGNREGDRPGLSPRHSGTVWTTYQLTPQWRVGGGLNFRSKQAPADVTAPAWEAPSFVTADLMAEYTVNQMYSIKANLTNVTDKLYGESLYRGHYIPGAGRLFQVSLTARF
ncbi:TonB-dependent siderophore receptor [Caenimonas sedimenti]|uniref:TonB-dependent siderophore receptor n=2 Tax=Caenimonas sedimenti TaxID=2596921 RepID=A0A562ZWU0_9BURK|nr:TonB-dependent siderophore receptor [Caenimonas sedimenti]TWO72827.1 TonB-dependent siderophore receptor [Caenimonas sedimenti]